MGALFIYILKSAFCLVLFYLFFRLLLSKETFHRFNRIALLGVLCLSWLIPWIEVTTSRQIEVNQVVLTIEQLLLMAGAEASSANANMSGFETPIVSWIQIVLFIYLVGILFFACRNIYSLVCLTKLLFSGKREKMEKGITLVVHEKEIAPFSWMKYVVISRKDLEENGREIIIHEIAHIEKCHSIDLLIVDICIFFQWFNPGAWLLKQELQNIHEYEADETVIKRGVNAKEYQLLLIKKAVGTRLYSMANSFNHSKLKKRITMMLKEKSSPWARMKYLYVLPLAAIAVTAFARPEVSETVKEISAVKVNDLTAIVRIGIEENVVKHPNTIVLGTRGEVRDTITVQGHKGTASAIKEKPLIIINGKESDSKVLDALNPASIESISVLKSSEEVKAYGEKGKNGVLLVQLYPENMVVNSTSEFPESIKNGVGTLAGERNVKYLGARNKIGIGGVKSGKEPLVIIDGKDAFGTETLATLDPECIESISVLKEKSALTVYGVRGKNGVILVTKKRVTNKLTPVPGEPYQMEDLLQAAVKNEPFPKNGGGISLGRSVTFHNATAEKPLIFVDDIELLDGDISSVPVDRIKSFTIMKDKSVTIDIYGDKAKHGVIKISTFTEEEYQARKGKVSKNSNTVSTGSSQK